MDKQKMMSNLNQYKYIDKFLGDIIRKRMTIKGFTRGMLTAHLLDSNESTKSDLDKLEHILQIGNSCCEGFNFIFEESKLSNKDVAIDGEIINILAEVKAFEILSHNGFKKIKKIKRSKITKTVDFTAKINGQNYAVEVTRLGIAQANRKKPVYLIKDKIHPHNMPGIRELEGEFFITSGKDNIPRTEETIRDAINNKFSQLKGFCKTQDGNWKGIIVISTGRDYFVMNKYANTEFEMHPNSVREALKNVWNLLNKEHGNFKYLQHIVITIDKDLSRTIIYPDIEKRSLNIA